MARNQRQHQKPTETPRTLDHLAKLNGSDAVKDFKESAKALASASTNLLSAAKFQAKAAASAINKKLDDIETKPAKRAQAKEARQKAENTRRHTFEGSLQNVQTPQAKGTVAANVGVHDERCSANTQDTRKTLQQRAKASSSEASKDLKQSARAFASASTNLLAAAKNKLEAKAVAVYDKLEQFEKKTNERYKAKAETPQPSRLHSKAGSAKASFGSKGTAVNHIEVPTTAQLKVEDTKLSSLVGAKAAAKAANPHVISLGDVGAEAIKKAKDFHYEPTPRASPEDSKHSYPHSAQPTKPMGWRCEDPFSR